MGPETLHDTSPRLLGSVDSANKYDIALVTLHIFKIFDEEFPRETVVLFRAMLQCIFARACHLATGVFELLADEVSLLFD